VTSEDKADFIGYAQAWFRFVKSHHDDEELELFPRVEEVVGTKGIWEETHKEHGMPYFLTSLVCFLAADSNSTRQNPFLPGSWNSTPICKI